LANAGGGLENFVAIDGKVIRTSTIVSSTMDQASTLGEVFGGQISEFIIYDQANDLDGTHQKRIQSYLAIKYGITLDQTTATDYIASDGNSIIWNALDNVGYTNDITIIGQDVNSKLDQKIAKNSRFGTGNDMPWVILSTTSDFISSNLDIARTSLGNGNFMAIASDAATTEFETVFEGIADTRMNRIWKVDELGAVGNVHIAIPNSGPSKYFDATKDKVLVLSTDASFDQTDTIIFLEDNGKYLHTQFNPSDGTFFTFASLSFSIHDISDTSIVENTTYTSTTPTISPSSLEITYSKSGDDQAQFTLNATTGVLSMTAQDFENPLDDNQDNVYEITLIATTSEGKTAELPLAITITNENEVVSLELRGIGDAIIAENSLYTSDAYSLSGVPQGTATYSLIGADAGLFVLDTNTNTVSLVAQDFENPQDANGDNIFEVGIEVTDADGNTALLNWTLSLINVIETSSLLFQDMNDAQIQENAPYASAGYRIFGEPIGNTVLSIIGADAALFVLDTNTHIVSLAAQDFENSQDANEDNIYEVGLQVVDQDGNSASTFWTVTIMNIVEISNLSLNGISDTNLLENVAYNSTILQIQGQPIGMLQYNLIGADANHFSFDQNNLQIGMTAKDFENPLDSNGDNVYEIGVQITDADGNTAQLYWTVAIENVQESIELVLVEIEDVEVAENNTYTSTTPSFTGVAQGTISFSLLGADASKFNLNSNTGVVSLSAKNFEDPLDSNTDNIYDISLMLRDSDGNSDIESWSVRVTDVIELRSLTIETEESIEQMEHSSWSSMAAVVGGDPIGQLTYTLEGLDAAHFTVDSQIGVLSNTDLDFESPLDSNTDNIYTFELRVTDSDDNTATVSIVYEVTDDPSDVEIDPALEEIGDLLDKDADITIEDLEDVEGLTGLDSNHIDAYISTFNHFKDQFSDPPSLEEIKALIDQVNKEQQLLQIAVTNFVGPTDNGQRNAWVIQDLYKYPNNSVYIYNRWGKLVFQSKGYNNDWKGIYEGQSEALPSGSYFYQMDLNSDGKVDQNGWIYISQ
ncbi:MAG: gliding motility-associated C-terminal domain-containing protein, partial [Flavobacteriaceae bacterium]|nr:gliding motility-associated C-terminal domain-containing protein [Flavobacteriaceae bacterium]